MKCLCSLVIMIIIFISISKQSESKKFCSGNFLRTKIRNSNNKNNFLILQNKNVTNFSDVKSKRFQYYSGEYLTKKRILEFNISKENSCDIYINDTVIFNSSTHISMIEHWILHNNADSIEPISIKSNQININYYNFNSKLNIFNVFFEYYSYNSNITEFSIEFIYKAIGVIKSFITQDSQLNDNLSQNYEKNNYNSLVWKIYNKNFIPFTETIQIILNFDLGEEFQKYDVAFSKSLLFFKKNILYIDKKLIVKYDHENQILPQDLQILDIKFPLYFDKCSREILSFFMIFFGSISIMFLTLMLYLIISSFFLNEL